MKISSVTIKNFKSLKHIELPELGSVSVFIGPSGSGKTATIEALNLFFQHFSNAPIIDLPSLEDRYWHLRKTDLDIEISVEFQLSTEIYQDNIDGAFAKRLGTNKSKRKITFVAKIQHKDNKTIWSNFVKLKNEELVAIGLESREEATTSPAPSDDEPEENSINDDGNHNTDTNEANIDQAGVESSDTTNGIETKDQDRENVSVLEPDQQAEVETIDLGDLVQLITSQFYWIRGNRLASVSGKPDQWDRIAFIPQEVQNKIAELNNSDKSEDNSQFAAIREAFEAVLPVKARLMVDQKGVYVYEGPSKFPLSLLGSGQQSFLHLLFEILEKDKMFVVLEEPELHIHPLLGKELFRFLRRQSKQIFLITHSPVFLDLETYPNNRVYSKEGAKSLVKQAKNNKDLKELLESLGSEASDALFPNKILLVGGTTEDVVVSAWLRTLGGDPSSTKLRVEIFDGDKDKRKIKVWAEAVKGTLTDLFILLDGAAEELAQLSINEGVPEENIHLIDGSLEDTYPINLVEKVLEEIFRVDWKKPNGENIKKINPKEPRVEEIRRIMREEKINSKDRWKVGLGGLIGPQMTTKDLDRNLRTFLKRISA